MSSLQDSVPILIRYFYRYVAPSGAGTRLLNSIRFIYRIQYNSIIEFKAVLNGQRIKIDNKSSSVRSGISVEKDVDDRP